jgi:hypothetical protein
MRHRENETANGSAPGVVYHPAWNAAITAATDWRETVAAGAVGAS